MNRCCVFLIVFLLLMMGGCTVGKDEEAPGDLYFTSTQEEKEIVLERDNEQPKPNREEIILKRRARHVGKEKNSPVDKNKVDASKKEGALFMEEAIKEGGKEIYESQEITKVEEPAVKEDLEEETKEKELELEEEQEYIFEPYYSAPLGSHGLFPDSDSAMEEGWRISEMDDPSSYLGFTPRGWEVYPVWYYSSADEAEVFYTLNFYH